MPDWVMILEALLIPWHPGMKYLEQGEGLVSVVARIGRWDQMSDLEPPHGGTLLIPEGAWRAFRESVTGSRSTLAIVIRERDANELD